VSIIPARHLHVVVLLERISICVFIYMSSGDEFFWSPRAPALRANVRPARESSKVDLVLDTHSFPNPESKVYRHGTFRKKREQA